jgi:ABC-type branched-subunit amino acid transport system substrate-binding protein
MDPVNPPPLLRVGFVAPLASGEAVVARPMLAAAERGARLAAAGRGARVEVVARDDGRDPARAAELVGELAADPWLVGVVGPKNSGSARAAAPVARAAGLPLLLPAATADDLCRLGAGCVFRLCATDQATAAAAASLCRRLGVARLAVAADATAYGRGLAAAVRVAARRHGVEPVATLDRADAAFHAMGEVEQAEAIRAARAAGFAGLLLGAEGGPGAALPALAGPAAEGALQLYAGAPAPGAATVYAAEATDAARLLVEAALAGPGRGPGVGPGAIPDPRAAPAAPGPDRRAAPAGAPDRLAVLAALRAAGTEGASGPLAFGPDGERAGAAVSVWRVRGGRSEPAADLSAAVAAADAL